MSVIGRTMPCTFPFLFFRYRQSIANEGRRAFPMKIIVCQLSLIHPRSITNSLRVDGSQLQIIWKPVFRCFFSCENDLAAKSEMTLPIIVAPEGPILVDKRIAIRVLNLRPFQHATVRVHVAQTLQTRICYESYGHFISDAHGNLDIARDASFGGTYKGIDGMGLFWSMLPIPGQRRGARWTTRDVTRPMHFYVTVFDGHVLSNSKASTPNEAVEDLPLPLANATMLRTYLSDDVERQEISDGSIRGTLFIPKGGGRFPGVIDMFGSHGGLLEFRAAILASYGYAVFALAFFDYKDLPTSFRNLDMKYLMDAVEWLASHDRVCQHGIGIIGVSFGGQVALQLAAECPMVAATVAVSSPNFLLMPVKYQGKSVGLQRDISIDNLTIVDDRTISSRGFYDLDSSESKQIEIPVEKIKGEVLVICGIEDACINSSKMAARMQKRLALHKKKSAKVLNYPGTGHLIEVPFMPMCKISFHKYYDAYFMWGGNVEEHSAAQEHSWKAIINFFSEHVQDARIKL